MVGNWACFPTSRCRMLASVTLGTGVGGCGVFNGGPIRKPFCGGGGFVFKRFEGGWFVGVMGCVVGYFAAGLVCGLVRGLRLWGGLWWWAMLRMAVDTSSENCSFMVEESLEICSSTLSSCCVWCWWSVEVRVAMQLWRPASQASLCLWDS